MEKNGTIALLALLLGCNPSGQTGTSNSESNGSESTESGGEEVCPNAVEPRTDTCGNGVWDAGETCWKALEPTEVLAWYYDDAPSIVAARLNGDDNLDVLMSRGNLFGTGTGAFSTVLPAGVNPALIDQEGDGFFEQASSSSLAPDKEGTSLAVSRFVPEMGGKVVYSGFRTWVHIAGGDFNGDGLGDLALGHLVEVPIASLGVYWAKGLSGGEMEVFHAFEDQVSGGYSRFAVGDLNKDGFDDIKENRRIYLGSPDGPVLGAELEGDEYFVNQRDLGTISDLNCDDRPDIASPGSKNAFDPEIAEGAYVVWLQGEAGVESMTRLEAVALDVVLDEVKVADINGDEVPDLILQAWHEQGVLFAYGRGDGTFLPAVPAPVEGWIAAVMGDFNNDGHEDLVGVSRVGETNTAQVTVLLARP